jgi:hypothetical protein
MNLEVTEYQFHKYVFSPVHNVGMKYGKNEVVTIERLLSDHNANKESRTKLRKLAHKIADLQEKTGGE